VTPQPTPTPAPAPQPVNKNTWAAKISATAAETAPVTPAAVEPAAKFPWANMTTADTTSTVSTVPTVSPLTTEEDKSANLSDQPNPSASKTDITETVTSEVRSEAKSQPTNENIPATETRKIDQETVEETEADVEPSVKLIDTVDKNVDKEESLEEDNDNKSNSTVITGPDSNGNFEADDNNFNNNSDTTCNHGLKEDKVDKPPLLNGDLETGEEVTSTGEVLPYKDDQWSPLNMEGKKQYDRDFLISLQANPLSLQKPETLPSNMDVILNSPNPDTMRNITSAPNLNNMFERQPFVRASHSHKGTPRNHSRRKESRQGAGMVITLPSQEVKLNEAENAWKPSKKDSTSVDDVESLTKKIRAILNKLCPQKFDTLVARFNDLVIDTEEKLVKAMELVFEKALDEPVFSVAYARMCQYLQNQKVQNQAGEYQDFRRLLLKRCQEEFQKDYMDDLDRKQYIENLDKAESEEDKKNVTMEFEAQEMKLRRRSLGNIRFIGELYKIKMLNGKIMHECILKLLCQTDEESLECLCRLVTTIGQLLEQETKTKQDQGNKTYNFEDYFNKMQGLVGEKKISARVRFLMQDVIDLRKANWIKRREDAGPKTIDQIHKEAQKEEMKQKLANMTEPPPSRKSEDRSSQRRSMIGRRENRQEDWNNIPTRAAKVSEKPDITKLNFSRVDPNAMSFGPGKSSWTRGSFSSSKKTSMQEPLLKVGNKFAGLLDDEGEAAMMPQVYHGRASEPAISKNRDRGYRGGGRSRDSSLRSRDGSYSGPNSREGSYSGRASREAGAGAHIETRDVIAEGSNNILRGDKFIDREKLEKKTKNLLDEYLNNLDLVEAFTCVTELFHVTTIHLLVEIVFNNVVERKEKDRVNAGRLFSHLLKNESLPRIEFLNGVEAVLEFAEDLLIDIPQFWEYFGVMIATILIENVLDIKFIQESSSILKSQNLDGAYNTAILHQMSRMNPKATAETLHKSGLKLSDLNINGSDDKLAFLAKPLENGVEEVVGDELDEAIAKKDVNSIFNFVDNKYPTLTKPIVRGLTQKVMMACIDGQEGCYVLNGERLRNFGVIVLKKYTDGVDERDRISKELDALFSFQSLVSKLEHPNKLLHNVFDVVYDCDLISEDAFLEWEENTDPEEQDGKGVALKSCTQFFQWLKTAEPEDDEEEKQKVTFQVGESS